ncbi:MAG: aldehyde dehydrogenase [Frankiales bacterium]|nr:aldehyde dehydrogenase [Frankiales bacterium]
MTAVQEVTDRTKLFVGGEWIASAATESIDVLNPATEEVIARVAKGTAADVDKAVAAAKAAFPGWSGLLPAERADHLQKVHEALTARTDEIGQLIADDMGMPVAFAKMIQVGLPSFNFAHYAELARTFAFEEEVGNSLVVREAVGVVGCITPWNYPLHQVALKVAAALAAGCTVVLKPSETAPLSAYVLAEVFAEVGLPAGVFNLVSGLGQDVGEALVAHPDVDMISFTGSTRAGKRIGEVAAGQVKRVALELGGKSANVILDDADLEKAVADGVGKCYLNSGQTCSALTRMLVPKDKLEQAEQIAKATAAMFQVGDPNDGSVMLGPLVSAAQLERVRGYIATGLAEGAKLVTGGAEPVQEKGYFVAPTVFSGVTTDMTIAQEEIFGPVLVLMPYEDEEDAVRIANDSAYGLGGGVWAGTQERAIAVARRMRTGQVEVNGGAFNPAAPFGGYKQSGIGREGGTYGLEEFLETKAIQR